MTQKKGLEPQQCCFELRHQRLRFGWQNLHILDYTKNPHFVIFRRNFFPKGEYSFQLSAFFYFSWNCPWRAEFKSVEFKTAELVSCKIKILGVTVVRKAEAAASNRAINHFLRLLRYSLTSSSFLSTKILVFWKKFRGFLVKRLFFLSKIIPFET